MQGRSSQSKEVQGRESQSKAVQGWAGQVSARQGWVEHHDNYKPKSENQMKKNLLWVQNRVDGQENSLRLGLSIFLQLGQRVGYLHLLFVRQFAQHCLGKREVNLLAREKRVYGADAIGEDIEGSTELERRVSF